MPKFEIGSEFWTTALPSDLQVPVWKNWGGEKKSFLSGRTALSAIIDDILSNMQVKSAYLPAYCCHTMIEPFVAHGINMEFYPVVWESGQLVQKIDVNKRCDIVLVMDYFGFVSAPLQLPQGAIVIRDMTHSLFAVPQAANYLFASLRKWGPVSGAAIACKAGSWNIPEPAKRNDEYLALRRQAYDLKAQFMGGEAVEKPEFLRLFSEAEELLEHDYRGYQADADALRVAGALTASASQRRTNAKILLNGIQGSNIVRPMFSHVGEKDVPLFVPVLVQNGMRDKLRKFLIENEVYCPTHWPLSKLHAIDEESRKIYDGELSLICDQRYDVDDMQREIDLINKFCGSR